MDKNQFYNVFLEQHKINKKSSGYSEYGSSVMPVLKLYKDLQTPEERNAYYEGLKLMLNDSSEEIRNYGISICLGFFVFRNQI